MLLRIFLAAFLITTGSVALAQPLRVGVDPNLKPFAYTHPSGEIVGFDIDIAKQACVDLKRECEFISVDWDGLIPSLLAGRIDVIISGMSITQARAQVVGFTRPYYKTQSQQAVLKGQGALVAGDKIGVLRGSSDESFVRNELPYLTLVTYDNQVSALLDLAAGRISAVHGPRIELEAGLEGFEAIKEHAFIGPLQDDPRYYGPGVGMAVHKDRIALLNSLNGAINRMYEDGRWHSISGQYFNIDIWAH